MCFSFTRHRHQCQPSSPKAHESYLVNSFGVFCDGSFLETGERFTTPLLHPELLVAFFCCCLFSALHPCCLLVVNFPDIILLYSHLEIFCIFSAFLTAASWEKSCRLSSSSQTDAVELEQREVVVTAHWHPFVGSSAGSTLNNAAKMLSSFCLEPFAQCPKGPANSDIIQIQRSSSDILRHISNLLGNSPVKLTFVQFSQLAVATRLLHKVSLLNVGTASNLLARSPRLCNTSSARMWCCESSSSDTRTSQERINFIKTHLFLQLSSCRNARHWPFSSPCPFLLESVTFYIYSYFLDSRQQSPWSSSVRTQSNSFLCFLCSTCSQHRNWWLGSVTEPALNIHKLVHHFILLC